jgi:hypothetical protein
MTRLSRNVSPAFSPTQLIEEHILLVRGHRVMLDARLAELYRVETGALNRAIKRNSSRFPGDFMFQLTLEEVKNLRFHFGISSLARHGGRRYSPRVFTEQGVAMLSSVLHSKRAIRVNVEIMRAFVRLRSILSSHSDLARRLDELEQRYDSQFKSVFDAIRELMDKPKEIGFRAAAPNPR